MMNEKERMCCNLLGIPDISRVSKRNMANIVVDQNRLIAALEENLFYECPRHTYFDKTSEKLIKILNNDFKKVLKSLPWYVRLMMAFGVFISNITSRMVYGKHTTDKTVFN